jgi:hypothetical protein
MKTIVQSRKKTKDEEEEKRKKASFLANYLTRKKNDGFFRLFE